MVPMILRVATDEEGESAEVPLTPDTTSRDVIECLRDPGELLCSLVHTSPLGQRALADEEKPLEVLERCGSGSFRLKYSPGWTGGVHLTRNGMREPEIIGDSLTLMEAETGPPDGTVFLVDCSQAALLTRSLRYGGFRKVRSSPVELSLAELEAMALRQTEEMAAQRQALQAREARLRYLKESQSRAGQMAAEQERLRRLRDRVEAQELKLSRLRTLRGQVDHGKASSAALTSDLDSIRALFNEKEKELSMAVAKVEELTRQLEEVRRGRQTAGPPPLCHELDRLRRELLYRNKLNEQQTARLSEQRDILCQRQIEMASIDKRIAELQERLHRKRMLNQQLANQINAASNKASANQVNRSGSGGGCVQGNTKQPILRSVQSGNIAAVEPYHHVPTYTSPTLSEQQQFIKQAEILKSGYGGGGGGGDIAKPVPATHHYVQETKGGGPPGGCGGGGVAEEGFGKTDPKYQTLPYNTKFTGGGIKRTGAEGNETNDPSLLESTNNNNNLTILNNNNNNSNNNNNNGSQMSVAHHGTPSIGVARKELMGKHPPSASPTSSTSSYSSISHLGHRVYGNNLVNASLMARGQPVGGSTTSSTSSLASGSSANSHHPQHHQHQLTTVTSTGSVQQTVTSRLTLPPTPLISDIQKPVNTVAPSSSPHHPLSNVYQSSSTKIHPVQPHTINPTSPQVPSSRDDLEKPALPPKPCVKPQPPPRQTHSTVEVGGAEPPPASIGLTVLTPPLRSIEDLSPNNNNTILSVNNNNLSCPDQGSHHEERTLEEGGREEDVTDRGCPPEDSDLSDRDSLSIQGSDSSHRKGNLKGGVSGGEKSSLSRRVSFDPLALLLDASLEGELELVARTAGQVKDPSAANDEGITALHNAICAGHLDIVTFLVRFGCDVNAQDSDGWTPLHCAASCNNTTMVRFLVEHGACIFATTLSDHETAAEKCEEDEEGFDGCSEYLYSVQEKLGIMNGGVVYAVFEYEAHNPDELTFKEGDRVVVLRKGDEWERDWWWARLGDLEGYIPRNLLGLYPRVHPNKNQEH